MNALCSAHDLLFATCLLERTLSNSLPAFGFLTVAEDDEHGFFGGYLVLSQLGRPLEFHCSTPVLPSKAQRILYGSTLRSYVLGELIGQTLVRKAKINVEVVLTDLQEMLSLGLVWNGSLAWVSANSQPEPSAPRSDAELVAPSLEVEGFRVTGSTTCSWSAVQMREVLTPLVSHVDLAEPFDRIREAIEEAQRVTEPATSEGDDHSAAA